GDLRERPAQGLGAVPDSTLVARTEARPMAKRRVAERCEQQIVEARPFKKRRLHPLENVLEDRLLLVAVDELSGRDLVLRLDDPPGLRGERADLRASRASRPDTGRHRRAPLPTKRAPPERLPDGYSARHTRRAPWLRF